jgi:hypothetical protein
MNSAVAQENEDNIRLRKSSEHIEYCKQAEAKALRDLADARQSLKRAREKHTTLFFECEKRAGARRKAGLIEVSANY